MKPAAPPQLSLFVEADEPRTSAKSATKEKTAEPSRHPWSWLLQRVFADEFLQCERCCGRLRIVEIAKKPDEIARALHERGYA